MRAIWPPASHPCAPFMSLLHWRRIPSPPSLPQEFEKYTLPPSPDCAICQGTGTGCFLAHSPRGAPAAVANGSAASSFGHDKAAHEGTNPTPAPTIAAAAAAEAAVATATTVRAT